MAEMLFNAALCDPKTKPRAMLPFCSEERLKHAPHDCGLHTMPSIRYQDRDALSRAPVFHGAPSSNQESPAIVHRIEGIPHKIAEDLADFSLKTYQRRVGSMLNLGRDLTAR
jgi:hypothetical protein